MNTLKQNVAYKKANILIELFKNKVEIYKYSRCYPTTLRSYTYNRGSSNSFQKNFHLTSLTSSTKKLAWIF